MKNFAIWTRKFVEIKHGSFVKSTEQIKVRVMAVAEGYAMVRRPRAMPFAVSLKDISDFTPPPANQPGAVQDTP